MEIHQELNTKEQKFIDLSKKLLILEQKLDEKICLINYNRPNLLEKYLPHFSLFISILSLIIIFYKI